MTVIDRSGAIYGYYAKIRQIGRLEYARIFGTALATSGRFRSVLDILEKLHFMRCEVNAITALLIAKNVFTTDEWAKQLETELSVYFGECAKQWPEVQFGEHELTITYLGAHAARAAREGWPP